MSENHHERTESLKNLAQEIEAERSSGEHTPFDAQDESDLVDDPDKSGEGHSHGDDDQRDDGSGTVPPLAVRP